MGPFALLTAVAARAGDIHTDAFAATVTAATRVETFSFADRLAAFADPGAPARTGGPACAITLAVDHPYFERPETVYASVAACDAVAPGEAVTVQYLGLADSFQFVSVRVRGRWAALPLMRSTGATGPMADCLRAVGSHCAPIDAPAL